jgi:regulator of protease activity HflC (stomatin/prohibitin superfamily)
MDRRLFWLSFIVKDDERGLLTLNGRFERMVGPGKHVLLDPNKEYSVEIFKIVRAEFPIERANLLEATHPEVAHQNLEIARAGEGEMLVVSFDGEPKHLVLPFSSRAFWKGATKIAVERIDTRQSLRIDRAVADRLNLGAVASILDVQVAAHEAGLLFADGAFVERLGPGRHMFWQLRRKAAVQKLDLRPQPLEVTAQEILTKDRIGLRLTLAAFYRIVDPEKTAMGVADLGAAIYRLIQFAVRESVASRALDDILSARESIDAEIRAFVGARCGELGVEMTQLGVKDVILPGEIRALLNKVVEAERTARANLIRRQEETASTRALLNTARLMEDNPLLMRLKELESLEKLVEKVGRIDLHANGPGGGLEALLQNLYRIGAAPREEKTD